MTLQGIDFRGLAYLIVLAIAGAAVYQLVTKGPQWARDLADKMKTAGQAAADAVNIKSDKNVAARAANDLIAPEGSSIGSRWADWFSPEVAAADAALRAPVVISWEAQLAQANREGASWPLP